MKTRGQGAFEYILMLSGVLLTVIMILMMMQGSIYSTNNTLSGNQNAYKNAVAFEFVSHLTPNLYVATATGGVTNAPCCTNQVAANQRCFGPYGMNTTTACNVNISCSSKFFNNATGACG